MGKVNWKKKLNKIKQVLRQERETLLREVPCVRECHSTRPKFLSDELLREQKQCDRLFFFMFKNVP